MIIKYLDLFAGIGGFTLGIQQAYEEEKKRHLGSKSTNKKSGQAKSKIQLGGKRASVEEERSILSTNNRRIWTIFITI